MYQRTLKKAVTFIGKGVHLGKKTNIRILPAKENSSISFVRVDLEGKPVIKADTKSVYNSYYATTIVNENDKNIKISTIEHLMSSFFGLGIDNAIVEIDGEEVPIMDGSAYDFIFLLESAGIQEQNELKKYIKIKKELFIEDDNGRKVEIYPYEGFKVSFEAEYNHPSIPNNSQMFTFDFSKKNFIKQISRARTFGFMKEVNYLREKGLVQGGSLKNAILLDDKGIVNEDGFRYINELVRHKILDILGDLYLLKNPVIGYFKGYKSGHGLNNKISLKLLEEKDKWEYVTCTEGISFLEFN